MKTDYLTRIKITADEGMVLTNGTNFGKIVYLAQTESPYDYHEITEAEYEKILEEQQNKEADMIV